MMLRLLQSTNTTTTNNDNDDDDMNPTLDLLAKIFTNALLFMLIFGLSCTVEVRRIKNQLTNKFALLTGIGMQFVVMPLLGFLAVVTLRNSGLSEVMGLTLLVVTTSPGGSYSNWFCALFNAELALSVAMTAISTIMAIGMLPGNLVLYSHLAYGQDDEGADNVVGALDFGSLFITLGVVISAILGGLYASYSIDSKTFRVWANRLANVSGIMLILVSAFLSAGGGGGEANLWDHPWTFYVGVAFPCVLGIVVATFIAKSLGLSSPETMTIAIECCYQNPGIATSVAITMFDDPDDRAKAVSVPLLYGGLQAIVIFIYCLAGWKLGWSKAPADDGFCTIIGTNYEIEDVTRDDEDDDDDDEDSEGSAQDVSEQAPDVEQPSQQRRWTTEELERIDEEDDEEERSRGWFSWLFGRKRRRTEPPTDNVLGDDDDDDDDLANVEDARFQTPTKKPDAFLAPVRDRFMSEDTQATTNMSVSSPSSPSGVGVVGGVGADDVAKRMFVDDVEHMQHPRL